MVTILTNILKFWFLYWILWFLTTGLTFVVYHIYYWSFIFLSYFLPWYALNLLMYSIIGWFWYLIYIKVYWE
jgi:hypothetical protein